MFGCIGLLIGLRGGCSGWVECCRLLFASIKFEEDKEGFLKEHAGLLLSYGGELMCLRHGSGHSSLR